LTKHLDETLRDKDVQIYKEEAKNISNCLRIWEKSAEERLDGV
jgi:hypothetical protein